MRKNKLNPPKKKAVTMRFDIRLIEKLHEISKITENEFQYYTDFIETAAWEKLRKYM